MSSPSAPARASRRGAQADDGQMGAARVIADDQLHDGALLPAESLAGTRRVPRSRLDARSVAARIVSSPARSRTRTGWAVATACA